MIDTDQESVQPRTEEYQPMAEEDYDDSPWTREELEGAARQAGTNIGWEEMDEYDRESERS